MSQGNFSTSQVMGPSQSMVMEATSEELAEMIEKETNSSESKVGKILSESTQKAVIVLVLAMLLSAAILDLPLFAQAPVGFSFGLKVLTYSYEYSEAFQVTLDSYLDSWKGDVNPLL